MNSTIGFGDLAPSSAMSKAFTVVFALLGIGLFASFATKLVALRLHSHASRRVGGRNEKSPNPSPE